MGLATIFANLAALAPAGVTNYALANTPRVPPPGALPCLLFELLGDRTLAIAYDVGGSSQAVEVEIQWLLLATRIGDAIGSSYVDTVAVLELVLAALAADLFLSAALIEPLAVVRVQFGEINRAGMGFFGVRLFLRVRYVP